MNMFLTHGGTSGSFLHNDSSGKFGLESTFEDLKQILDIIFYWLGCDLHFFGVTITLFSSKAE